ncbi:fibronectin-binding protein A N-terminus-domain-containing protein, partial [Pilaira anomala]
FNALDVRATVINLRERLIGIRLQNIYDVNSKTFLFKFAKPDDKELVLVESGVRIHTTQFSRDKSITPSAFCAKLRKHLRTRRVTNVRQLGIDRIVDFEFAGGEMGIGYHVICEFYSSGNIILTDHEYRIMALLRPVQATETLNMAVGEIYNVKSVLSDFQKVDADQLRAALRSAGPKDTLKKLLNFKFEYGPAMVEDIILGANLDPNMKVVTDFDTSKDSFQKGDELIESTKNIVHKGYIILLDEKSKPKTENREDVEIYDEFHPHLYKQFTNRQYKEFPTFDSAVDEFFSAIESQKLELKTRRQEEAALKKLDSVRKEQEKRVKILLDQQITNERKAQLIELNLPLVDAAITIIRNAVASQMDWQDLNDLVKEEKRRQNPVALIIDTLKLDTNQLTLILSDPEEFDESESESESESDDDDKEDEETPKEPMTFKVDVEIGLTAFANARKYYEQKKTTASKHEKTLEASSKALKSAERKIRQDLKETKITASINKIRKPFWFEKFLWFISTDGHLVIAGRDMQQNELLVKRYLLKDDAYVHADLHGAASVIVKNKPNANGQPIPPSTLYQAGIMSVCQSKAWDAKMVTSAYWVYPDQVSKSAPSGEYLTTGSFMIRGKKNFLPPVQLVYGFGYVFKLDESCIGNHIKDSNQEEEEGGEGTQEEAEKNVQRANKPDYRDAIEETSTETQDTKKEEEAAAASAAAEEKPTENTTATTPEQQDKPETEEEDEEETNSDDNSSSTDSDDDDENAFPDTQLNPLNTTTTTTTTNATKSTEDKYNLEDYGQDSDEDQALNTPTSGSNTPAKRFITAKERRLMKKNNVTEVTEAIKEQQKQKQKQQPKQKQEPAKPKPVAVPAPTRGRKGKAKKIKDKYADQDEEEKQLRMELLASDKGPQPKGKKAKRDAKAKEEKAALEKERAALKKAAEEKAYLEKKQKKQQQEEEKAEPIVEQGTDAKDTETIRQMLKEENITMLEADEIANLSVLDSFTPNPLPEDIIHFAIPVCAPYVAIQKYKYKVKLTPGSLKRGKAVKQAQSVFFHLADATAREKELIKGVPDMESINTMMGKVKVSAPNLEASKRKKGGNRR